MELTEKSYLNFCLYTFILTPIDLRIRTHRALRRARPRRSEAIQSLPLHQSNHREDRNAPRHQIKTVE